MNHSLSKAAQLAEAAAVDSKRKASVVAAAAEAVAVTAEAVEVAAEAAADTVVAAAAVVVDTVAEEETITNINCTTNKKRLSRKRWPFLFS